MTPEQERTPVSIGQIALSADGFFTIYYYGEHAEQGGISFTRGNMGSKDVTMLFKYVGEQQLKHKDLLLDMIKKYWDREDKKDDSKKSVRKGS